MGQVARLDGQIHANAQRRCFPTILMILCIQIIRGLSTRED